VGIQPFLSNPNIILDSRLHGNDKLVSISEILNKDLWKTSVVVVEFTPPPFPPPLRGRVRRGGIALLQLILISSSEISNRDIRVITYFRNKKSPISVEDRALGGGFYLFT